MGELTVSVYTGDGYVAADSDYVAELRDAPSRAAEATLLVAVDESIETPVVGTAVVGTVTFCLAGSTYADLAEPGEAEFRMLAVAPAARGRRIGEQLVGRCVELARAAGCSGLALSSMETMSVAHRIYQRFGFTRVPERDWEPAPGVRLVAFLLRL